MLALVAETSIDEPVRRALRLAVIGSTEMAGLLSRWDRFYLKSYEAMAGHRFNFATFVAEPNVWGATASGRGTVRRRLASFAKSSRWISAHVGRSLSVVGPFSVTSQAFGIPVGADVCIAEGSSERLALESHSVDLVLTDPPYHDDVEYDELSLPLRAWGGMAVNRLKSAASVNSAIDGRNRFAEYSALLGRIFAEVRRTLKDDGHLIFSYANREPAAWVALLSALESAGFTACGYLVVHAENETDVAKRGVRACNLDLLMDLVPRSASVRLEQWKPMSPPVGAEEEFVSILGEAFLQVGSLPVGWKPRLIDLLRHTPFLIGAAGASRGRAVGVE
jgi:adenine-specific DNA methylase